MRAQEFIVEYRNRLLQYVKSLLPTWPEYVLKDWLVPNKGNFSNLPTDAIKNGIMEKVQGAGLTPNSKWQLVPNMKFTMDMFDPKTKQLLIGRAGGSSDLGMGIPKDKERHATQAALAQQQGGVRSEPVLLIKSANGYELIEGWHRTIQHFHKFPDGYTGPAYVTVAQGQQGLAEGKITLSTDPNWYGATVDNYQASGPVVNIPANQLVGFEPDDKMNQPKSKVNVEKIVAGLKQGAKLPPLLVRKYKNGYQVLDGHHRFWAYKLLGVKSIPSQIVPDSDIEEISKQGVAEGATVTRIDSKPITDFGSSLKAYKHTDDWSQSGVDTGDDSYWKNKNLKTNTTKGLFAGDPKRTALYATGNAHETRYVEFTQNGQPIVYFDRKDLPAMRSRKTYLTVFDASDFRQLPTGEWFSENPSKPIKQVPIGDPFKYIASQGWIVRVTDDLDKVFKQVKNMHKAGKIAQYGAEGMNESKQGVAEDN